MAVMPMKQVLICGMQQDQSAVLADLQQQGVLEIRSLKQEEGGVFFQKDTAKNREEAGQTALLAEQALAVLDQYVPEKKELLSFFEGRIILSPAEYEAKAAHRQEIQSVAEQILSLSKQIGVLEGEIPKLEQDLMALAPWEKLDLPLDAPGTKHTVFLFGSVPRAVTAQDLMRLLTEQSEAEVDVGIVSSSKEQTCFWICCFKEKKQEVEAVLQQEGLIKAPELTGIPAKKREELSLKLKEKKEAIAALTEEIRCLGSVRADLQFLQDASQMAKERANAQQEMLQSQNVFLLSGYLTAKEAPMIQAELEKRFDVFVELNDPAPGEDVPVVLENHPLVAPVEGIVESYSLPGPGERDPSAVMAPFYYILFGLMLSDAAYGLIMSTACGICLKKFPHMEQGTKKFLQMFFWCGISTIFWGLMFGSFFGDAVNVIATTFFHRPDIRLAPLWFEPVSLPMKMLVFSFVLGIIHLFTGLGMKLYECIRSGHVADGIYDAVFWYLLVGGAILYLLTMSMFTNMLNLGFTLSGVAVYLSAAMVLVGFVGIVLTSGRESKNWGKRLLKGLYGAYGITSYLSDILSYSRLLALGLATSVISTVFNQMGSMLGDTLPGVILFILVFVIGHAINAMGAYVHTNRLQFVEFFGKFYEGGGRKFSPFGIHTKYFNVKEETK